MSTETITNGAAPTAEAAYAASDAVKQAATSSINIQIANRHMQIIAAGAVAYVVARKVGPWLKSQKKDKPSG